MTEREARAELEVAQTVAEDLRQELANGPGDVEEVRKSVENLKDRREALKNRIERLRGRELEARGDQGGIGLLIFLVGTALILAGSFFFLSHAPKHASPIGQGLLVAAAVSSLAFSTVRFVRARAGYQRRIGRR